MSEPAGIHIFSLEEARKTLPLIRPIVEDVTECHHTLNKLLQDMDRQDTIDPDISTDDSIENAYPTVTNYRETLTEYVHEIYDLGAEIHDFDQGRVDFPARFEHRVVYLCWNLNDDDILYWHDTYAPCHKRRRIDEEDFESS